MGEPSSPKKFEVLDGLLDQYEYVFIHVDAAAPGVVLPDHLIARGLANLQVSRNFHGAFTMNEERIEAELLFGGSYFHSVIPLAAIMGVTTIDGRNYLWPESVPHRLLESFAASPQPAPALKSAAKGKSRKPNQKPKASTEKGSHLRRIK